MRGLDLRIRVFLIPLAHNRVIQREDARSNGFRVRRRRGAPE